MNYFTKQIDIENVKHLYYYRALSRFNTSDDVGSLEDINRSIENYPGFIYFYDLRSQIKNKLKDYIGEEKDLSILIDLLNARIDQGKENKKNIRDLEYKRRESSAYLFVEGPSWEKARRKARAVGGRLVTINDRNENRWGMQKDFSRHFLDGFQHKDDFWKYSDSFRTLADI